jgi:hypothetical protein
MKHNSRRNTEEMDCNNIKCEFNDDEAPNNCKRRLADCHG